MNRQAVLAAFSATIGIKTSPRTRARQERADVEQRRALDREEQQQQGRHHRGQLLVAEASAYEETPEPIHARREADPVKENPRGESLLV